MKNCTITDFINKTPKEKIDYFYNVILDQKNLEWEAALHNAVKEKDESKLNGFTGLKPFYKDFKDLFKIPKKVITKSKKAPTKKKNKHETKGA